MAWMVNVVLLVFSPLNYPFSNPEIAAVYIINGLVGITFTKRRFTNSWYQIRHPKRNYFVHSLGNEKSVSRDAYRFQILAFRSRIHFFNRDYWNNFRRYYGYYPET